MINDNIFNENERFLCLTKSFSFSFIHQAKKKHQKEQSTILQLIFSNIFYFSNFRHHYKSNKTKKPQTKTKNYNLQ